MTPDDTADRHLAAQYEAYPYPHRDPRDEARRLIIGSPGHLREIDHWVFGGHRPASRPLRALIGGGGSGDAAIMLAQQLHDAGRDGRVTYLDRSRAATAIARARAEARKLDLEWCDASILDLPTSGLGPFDYIDCCGVLHHLPDPGAGLRALCSVLAPDGGLGLMVYAPHGRTGVYMLQDALRRLALPDDPPSARLDIARRVMRHLPESAWLRRNTLFADHLTGGDAGLYDLLLNPRDRAYDVGAFLDMLDRAGLRATALIEPLRYDPAIYLPDPKLRARIAALPWHEQAALAEELCGNMSVHVVYCTRAERPFAPADPHDAAAVPIAREMPGPELAKHIRADGTLAFLFDGLRAPFNLPPLAPAILGLIDGRRCVGEIAATLAQRGVSAATFSREWAEIWRKLNGLNRILLRAA